MMKLRFLLLFMVFFGIFSTQETTAQELTSDEVNLMKSRIQELLLVNVPDADSVDRMISTMNPDGSWDGIEYNSISVEPWPPMAHLGRYVMPMAKAFADKNSSYYHNEKLVTALHKALNFWLDHNFVNKNWWEAEIGIPLNILNTFILMGDEMTYEEMLKGLNLTRGSIITQTGQNKVWRTGIQVKIALVAFGRGRNNLIGAPQLQRLVRKTSDVLLMEPEDLITLATDTLKSNLIINPDEGIQVDESFHQHGVQLQFGNYGLDYALSHAEWIYILNGTHFAYPERKVEILRNYVLGGLTRATWKDFMDVSGLGRHIIYPGQQKNRGQTVVRLLELMKKADASHEQVYQQGIDFNTGKSASFPRLQNNTYYWRSAMMINRTDKNYVSVRMNSKRIQSTESGWGVNIKGAHLADGATYVYRYGGEYEDIYPVWDWRRIPGVTAYSNKKLPEIKWEGLLNDDNFVGGVSDTTNGVAAMFFKRNGLQAKKGWFFTPDGVVCLGADINSSEAFDVVTSINQSLLKGVVTVGSGKNIRELSSGQNSKGNSIKWVYHDGIGYVFLQNENVYVGADNQTGTWKSIHISGSDAEVQEKVFNLWVDHGIEPENRSYAYMIKAEDNAGNMQKTAKNPGVSILKNNSDVQAVLNNNGMIQAIFYNPGTLQSKGLSLSVSAPCMLMATAQGKQLKLTASVPPELSGNVTVALPGQYQGEGCTYHPETNMTDVTFHLGTGQYAGQSMSIILEKK